MRKTSVNMYTEQEKENHERVFFDELYRQLSTIGVKSIGVKEMSDKTLNLTYNGMQFGRVKFSRRGHTIQTLTYSKATWEKNITIEMLLNSIPKLVKYIMFLKRHERIL